MTGCAPFCVSVRGGRGSCANHPVFGREGVNQPAATDAATPDAFENGTSQPASRQNQPTPCLLGRNKISSKQPVAPGTQQPERLTMSTILTADLDTNGLDVDDTTSVARAFAIIGATCITFAIIAGATIASIA